MSIDQIFENSAGLPLNDSMSNLEKAFSILSEHFSVPRIFVAKDFASVDEKAIMAYVSLCLSVFQWKDDAVQEQLRGKGTEDALEGKEKENEEEHQKEANARRKRRRRALKVRNAENEGLTEKPISLTEEVTIEQATERIKNKVDRDSSDEKRKCEREDEVRKWKGRHVSRDKQRPKREAGEEIADTEGEMHRQKGGSSKERENEADQKSEKKERDRTAGNRAQHYKHENMTEERTMNDNSQTDRENRKLSNESGERGRKGSTGGAPVHRNVEGDISPGSKRSSWGESKRDKIRDTEKAERGERRRSFREEDLQERERIRQREKEGKLSLKEFVGEEMMKTKQGKKGSLEVFAKEKGQDTMEKRLSMKEFVREDNLRAERNEEREREEKEHFAQPKIIKFKKSKTQELQRTKRKSAQFVTISFGQDLGNSSTSKEREEKRWKRRSFTFLRARDEYSQLQEDIKINSFSGEVRSKTEVKPGSERGTERPHGDLPLEAQTNPRNSKQFGSSLYMEKERMPKQNESDRSKETEDKKAEEALNLALGSDVLYSGQTGEGLITEIEEIPRTNESKGRNRKFLASDSATSNNAILDNDPSIERSAPNSKLSPSIKMRMLKFSSPSGNIANSKPPAKKTAPLAGSQQLQTRDNMSNHAETPSDSRIEESKLRPESNGSPTLKKAFSFLTPSQSIRERRMKFESQRSLSKPSSTGLDIKRDKTGKDKEKLDKEKKVEGIQELTKTRQKQEELKEEKRENGNAKNKGRKQTGERDKYLKKRSLSSLIFNFTRKLEGEEKKKDHKPRVKKKDKKEERERATAAEVRSKLEIQEEGKTCGEKIEAYAELIFLWNNQEPLGLDRNKFVDVESVINRISFLIDEELKLLGEDKETERTTSNVGRDLKKEKLHLSNSASFLGLRRDTFSIAIDPGISVKMMGADVATVAQDFLEAGKELKKIVSITKIHSSSHPIWIRFVETLHRLLDAVSTMENGRKEQKEGRGKENREDRTTTKGIAKKEKKVKRREEKVKREKVKEKGALKIDSVQEEGGGRKEEQQEMQRELRIDAPSLGKKDELRPPAPVKTLDLSRNGKCM